jgi:hypothetical protein
MMAYDAQYDQDPQEDVMNMDPIEVD